MPQSLEDIKRAIDTANGGGGETEALLLISPLGEYAVVEITGGSTNPAGGVPLTAHIEFNDPGKSNHTDDYLKLSPGGVFPPTLKAVSFAGILEEYRYYIRQPDETGEVMPTLSRARFYPNTETAYQDDAANLHEDVADNVIDLQLALGVDTNLTERIEEGDGVTLQKSDDDWLFNSVDDDDPTGDAAATALWNDVTHLLYYLRVTTVARTDRRDPGFQAPPLEVIEDKDYADSAYAGANSLEQRMYRRRILQTAVDLRNL